MHLYQCYSKLKSESKLFFLVIKILLTTLSELQLITIPGLTGVSQLIALRWTAGRIVERADIGTREALKTRNYFLAIIKNINSFSIDDNITSSSSAVANAE